jgi:hypothetical protein
LRNSDLQQLDQSDNERGRSGYSLEHSPTDESFCTNLKAVLRKRTIIYRSNKKFFLMEALVPGIIIIIGILISKYASFKSHARSDPRHFTTNLLPKKQKTLFNTTPMNQRDSDMGTEVLAYNLPQADTAFDIYFDRSKRTREDSYEVFGWSVFDFGQKNCAEEPYMYTSYDIFQASRLEQNYKFVSHVNTTSRDIAVLGP